MKMNSFVFMLSAFAISVTQPAGQAAAATVFQISTPTGNMATPGSFTEPDFSSGAGAGNLSFQIQGFGSLDGVGCCTDTLSVKLDGALLFQGSFDLGGGGVNTVFANPNGATFNSSSPGFKLGGLLNVSIPLLLSGGIHTLVFDYAGELQIPGDEGWGINSVTVTGTSATPLPAAFPLFATGLGALGLLGRRRKRKSRALAA